MKRSHALAACTLIYTLFTFIWAVIWHVGLFRSLYDQFGYFSAEPIFALGLMSIVLQGVLLSWGYFALAAHLSAWHFALLAGTFYWTCHVISHAAKNPQAANALFFGMETLFLGVQFGVFALALSWLAPRIRS